MIWAPGLGCCFRRSENRCLANHPTGDEACVNAADCACSFLEGMKILYSLTIVHADLNQLRPEFLDMEISSVTIRGTRAGDTRPVATFSGFITIHWGRAVRCISLDDFFRLDNEG